jgi:flagellar hook-basal body complex protein FliE
MFDVTQISKDAASRAELSFDRQLNGLTEKKGGSFKDVLDAAISGARTDEKNAADMAEKFANGDPSVGMHETIIAAEKASISVRYAVSLKNKLLESYRELMNTPL